MSVSGRHGPPEISPSMATVLRNVGLQLTEQLVHVQQRSSKARPAFAVLLPGLARGCTSTAYMEAVLRTCSSGAADTVLLLQFANESKQSTSLLDFSACSSILRHLGSKHRGCSFVFARQQFHALERQTCATPPGRVEMQTLSVGRAYEWARHVLGEHRFYVRARLDDSGWCVPPPAFLPRGEAWVVFDGVGEQLALDGSRVRFFSDRYALVPATLASAYFEAWRIWSRVDCSHPCRAGYGHVGWGARLDMRAWASEGTKRPYKWSSWEMTGECAVTTWMESNSSIIPHLAGDLAGNRLFKMRNATHVLSQGAMSSVTVEDWLRAQPRMHDMTAACRPVALRGDRQALVKPPLPALNQVLSCQGKGVLGLCDKYNVSIDGAALVEWAMLLVVVLLVAERVWWSRRRVEQALGSGCFRGGITGRSQVNTSIQGR